MPIPNLKITFRQLWQSKLYSSINVIGLAIGITCMLLAILYWKDERSFDAFHQNNPDLYRITTTLIENKGAGKQTIGGTGQVQGPAFKSQVPEVKDYVRVLGGDVPGDVMANGKSLELSRYPAPAEWKSRSYPLPRSFCRPLWMSLLCPGPYWLSPRPYCLHAPAPFVLLYSGYL